MNDGLINEQMLREYINKDDYWHYNENIQHFLSFVFQQDLNPMLPFCAYKIAGQQKPDLCIQHNGVQKYISIKKGEGNSVHQENISVFFPFIESMLGTTYLNYLKKFHYGDDTIDDTGIVRYSGTQCKIRYADEIQKLNQKLNEREHLAQFLDRFLFVGNVPSSRVDVIYHGTIDYGLWASREEIFDYAFQHSFSVNAIHFAPLTYQVWGRNEKRTAKHPERRYVMQVKWGSLSNDFMNIRRGNWYV